MTPYHDSVPAVLLLVARLSLGLVFLRSAIGKLRDIRGFAQGVDAYRIVPTPAAHVVATLLTWIELALACALIIGVALPWAGLTATLLLLSFITAVVSNLRRARVIACNCHGVAGTRTISWGTVARNIVLLLFTIPIIVLAPNVYGFNGAVALWSIDLHTFASVDGLAVALLLAFCFVLMQIIEWAVDSATRAVQLARRSIGKYKRVIL